MWELILALVLMPDIHSLSSESFTTRESAHRRLAAVTPYLGSGILRLYLQHPDPELRSRVRRLYHASINLTNHSRHMPHYYSLWPYARDLQFGHVTMSEDGSHAVLHSLTFSLREDRWHLVPFFYRYYSMQQGYQNDPRWDVDYGYDDSHRYSASRVLTSWRHSGVPDSLILTAFVLAHARETWVRYAALRNESFREVNPKAPQTCWDALLKSLPRF